MITRMVKLNHELIKIIHNPKPIIHKINSLETLRLQTLREIHKTSKWKSISNSELIKKTHNQLKELQHRIETEIKNDLLYIDLIYSLQCDNEEYKAHEKTAQTI